MLATIDAEQVIRHVVKIIRDEQRVQLSMDHMATLKFIRGGRTAKGKRPSGDHWKHAVLHRVTGVDRQEVEALVQDFSTRYDDLAVNLHSPAIRGVLRNYLTALNALPMKTSGGVYFVHKSQWGAIDALQTLVRWIGQGCSLEQFPMVDTGESREMLTEAFQADVENEVRLLLHDVNLAAEAAQRGRPLTWARWRRITARYEALVNATADWATAPGLPLGQVQTLLARAALDVGRLSVTASLSDSEAS